MFSGTELVVVILAAAGLIVMAASALVGILTRLRRGIVDRGVRSATTVRRLRRRDGADLPRNR